MSLAHWTDLARNSYSDRLESEGFVGFPSIDLVYVAIGWLVDVDRAVAIASFFAVLKPLVVVAAFAPTIDRVLARLCADCNRRRALLGAHT